MPLGEACPDCGRATENGVCLNIDCARARRQATSSASRETAKASGTMAGGGPRAFTSSGRVD